MLALCLGTPLLTLILLSTIVVVGFIYGFKSSDHGVRRMLFFVLMNSVVALPAGLIKSLANDVCWGSGPIGAALILTVSVWFLIGLFSMYLAVFIRHLSNTLRNKYQA